MNVYLISQQVRRVMPKSTIIHDEVALMIGASKLEALLKDEQAAFGRSRERVLHLENESQQRSAKIEELSHREKELEDRCREKVRSYNSSRIRPLTVLNRNESYSLMEAMQKG